MDASGLKLFQFHPEMSLRFPYLPLAALPTPVQAAVAFGRRHAMGALYIKRDDATGTVYGGNKIRKLGFLLAQARESGAKEVITFGGAGSNHALATALCARPLGMRTSLILGPQHNSHAVRANLRAGLASGAALHGCEWQDTPSVAASLFFEAWKRDGIPPCVIPAGGSSPLGILGYINAAYELHQQIAEGRLPTPDLIYVASGTMGTCVGLAIGLRALGMKTCVTAVRVTMAPYTSMERAQALFSTTVDLCRQGDSSFPQTHWSDATFILEEDYFGGAYALYTPESIAAVKKAHAELGLPLEGTYTGKTFAALLGHAAAGLLRNKCVLFWNTYNGLPHIEEETDLAMLPPLLRQYFEMPLQPLDNDFSALA